MTVQCVAVDIKHDDKLDERDGAYVQVIGILLVDSIVSLVAHTHCNFINL